MHALALVKSQLKSGALTQPRHIRAFGAPLWHVDRANQPSLPLDQATDYTTSTALADIYVLDTGLNTSALPPQFNAVNLDASTLLSLEPRSAASTIDTDDNGHGTFVAAIATSLLANSATNQVRVYGLKVLDAQGQGSAADILTALEVVLQHHASYGQQRSCIINMSLGGWCDGPCHKDAMVRAIDDSISSACTVVVAAGNMDGADARFISPAAANTAFTVGASDITDSTSTFSNVGPSVNVYAPGQDIAVNYNGVLQPTMSGTSMAAPYASGLIARGPQRLNCTQGQVLFDTGFNDATLSDTCFARKGDRFDTEHTAAAVTVQWVPNRELKGVVYLLDNDTCVTVKPFATDDAFRAVSLYHNVIANASVQVCVGSLLAVSLTTLSTSSADKVVYLAQGDTLDAQGMVTHNTAACAAYTDPPREQTGSDSTSARLLQWMQQKQALYVLGIALFAIFAVWMAVWRAKGYVRRYLALRDAPQAAPQTAPHHISMSSAPKRRSSSSPRNHSASPRRRSLSNPSELTSSQTMQYV